MLALTLSEILVGCRKTKDMNRARSDSRSRMLRLRDSKKSVAEKAVKRFYTTKQAFVNAIQPSRTTVWRFFAGEPISLDSFEEICLRLNLDMYDVGEEITALQIYPIPTSPDKDAEYVVSIRERVYSKIKDLCGTIQLIGRPIPISRYVELSIFLLDDMLTHRYESPEVLSSDFALDNYNRDLGAIRHLPRISGQKAVNEYSYMLVYGWPGFGKTSYLKRLVIQCNEGEIHAGLVPVFLRARNFILAKDNFNLFDSITTFLAECGVENPNKAASSLMQKGKMIVFLDGLDELPEAHSYSICENIYSIVDKYYKCRFIFSCRLPLMLQFPRFQKFLVYGFDRNQRKDFAEKWFTYQCADANFFASFNRNLKRHRALSELARTPLLMELLCRVFQDQQKFPPTRASLYTLGIESLLYREPSNLDRDAVWDFLRQVAVDFFIQDEPKILLDRLAVLDKIEEIFSPVLKKKLDIRSSKYILEKIELSYGLLTNYSQNFCAFSHLTFQEYFTAEYLVRSNQWEIIFERITDPKWQFIIELVAELLPLSKKENFFTQFKQSLDSLIINNRKLSNFLRWVNWMAVQVMDTVESAVLHKQTLLRAWYFVFTLKNVHVASNTGQTASSFFVLPDFDLATSTVSSATLDAHIDLYRALHATRTDQYREFEMAVPKIRGALRAIANELDDTLLRLLHQLDTWETVMRKQKSQFNHPITWWESNRDYWRRSICYVMETLHGLQGNWEFSEEEKNLLIIYYRTSRLLSICTVRAVQRLSKDQREQVVDSLLSIPLQEYDNSDVEFEGFR